MSLIKAMQAILACCVIPTLLAAQSKTLPAPKPNNQSAATPNAPSSGPTFEERTKFIVDQTLDNSPLTYSLQLSGDKSGSMRVVRTYNSFSIQGCIASEDLEVIADTSTSDTSVGITNKHEVSHAGGPGDKGYNIGNWRMVFRHSYKHGQKRKQL
jgi:hypothetical protein